MIIIDEKTFYIHYISQNVKCKKNVKKIISSSVSAETSVKNDEFVEISRFENLIFIEK
jgi:hypothetical protein